MQRMRWEYGCGESASKSGESGWKCQKCQKCGELGQRCKEPRWKLKYSGRNNIDMINDKFKEWAEVEIIENKHICKNLVSKI